MRTFTIVDDVFKTEPLFVVDCSHAQMAAYLKKRFNAKVEDVPEAVVCGQMLTFNDSPWRVVWVERLTRKTLPNVIHELLHLVTRICADKGIPIIAHHPNGDNGDESAAYLLEYFVKNVLPQVRR